MKTNHIRPPKSPAPANIRPRVDQRSPLEFPFGCFIADAPSYGGAQGFTWFAEADDVLGHLRNGIAELYETDGDALALVTSLAVATEGCAQLTDLDLASVNEVLVGVCEVRWVGSLDDLYLGDEPFENEIQSEFRDNIHGEERGFLGSEIEDFACHLEHYAQ